ncbi:hypothetical protein ATO6_00805 [Oceanicola sp. 22II-s10i]|uniref:acetyl-CoA carboxylase biotin carboxyl carrier protein subunit n=1 Tax=Oceanicola sp. 22II-s10i TaxID=1317116 RepID=UPI000B51EDE5|nr:acetyl-CoA carboxylase biotin carboxyl carrier protein subunit [Oceanicola sp. 22II-s10i]OWU85517.1 hypothetical protein ATO6_00805 [Oceanicola sp. 22II-s10i]
MADIELKSDVSGRVWQIPKSAGDSVEAEEAVIIIESMKMEIPVAPEQSGTVVKVLVAEGDEVEEDQTVAIFSPD